MKSLHILIKLSDLLLNFVIFSKVFIFFSGFENQYNTCGSFCCCSGSQKKTRTDINVGYIVVFTVDREVRDNIYWTDICSNNYKTSFLLSNSFCDLLYSSSQFFDSLD